MSATATLPLPVELTSPAKLEANLETQIRKLLDVENTKYNPVTQVRENLAGVPQIHNGLTISLQVSTVVGVISKDNDKQQDDR